MSATIGSDAANVNGIDLGEGPGIEYFMTNAEQRKQLIANATTLEEGEWETVADTVVRVYHENLVGISDLQNAGLTRSLSLATTIDVWQDVTAFTEADVSMDGEAGSEEDRVNYSSNRVAIPIVHKDFKISGRELMTSRNMGNDLRTDNVAAATRQVVEKLEELLFNGWTPNIRDDDNNTASISGYTTATNRNTVSGSDWGTAGNVRDDVVSGLDAMDDDNRTPGDTGFWLYIAPTQWQQFRSAIDPDGDGNLTVRQRINEEFGAEIGAIRRASKLTDEYVMVDPSPDVVELAVAEDVQTVEWQSGSGLTNYFKVLAAMAPEIKSDSGGRSGIVHATGI